MTSYDLNDQIFVQIIEKAIGGNQQEITDLQCLFEIFSITGPRTFTVETMENGMSEVFSLVVIESSGARRHEWCRRQ